jgi:hypothetical protein
LQRLGEAPRAAVVVEARYSALFKLDHVPAGWIADVLARLQVRYPEIQVVFADSRKFAEEWTYRFLAAALAEATDRTPQRTPATDAAPRRPAAASRPRTRTSGPG